MRLLFIYFYEDKATFRKGTIIRFNKKYNIVKSKIMNNDFNFDLSLNIQYQDDFYSQNSDIGVIIGENGTGKSILLNSIRDKKNDYSFCVYEEAEKFYLLENDLFKLQEYKVYNNNNIPYKYESDILVKINDKKLKFKRKFKSIYYSSILESINENLNDDFDISNINLLNKIDETDLNKKIEQLEINDLQKMEDFKYPIKFGISQTFFEEAKNFIKNSYIQLFEKTMQLLRENTNNEKIDEIFSKLPEPILKDIMQYHLEEDELFIKEIENNQNIVNKYIDIYKENIYKYLKNNKIDFEEESLNTDKKINEHEDKLFTNDFLSQLINISLDGKTKNTKDIIENIRKLFDIKYTHSIAKNQKRIVNRMLQYLNIEKIFDKCLLKLKIKKEKTVEIEKNFNIYKLYYLKRELGYEGVILIDLFKKGKFKDILLFDKKYESFHYSKENEEIIDAKEKTVNQIKQIIENNYSLFYDVVKSDLKNLDDELLKLILIKKVELNYEKDESHKAIYIYLSELLRSQYIENYEKEFLYKEFQEKRDFAFEILRMYHKKCKEKTPLLTNNEIDINKYNEFVKDVIHPFSFTFDPPISSGQKAKETISARINDVIQKINVEKQSENILILLDEADLKLHLEWQRKFVRDLIEFLNTYSDNKFYILYATHSPMILSDITDDRVVFLQKNGKYSIDVSENYKTKKRTFGANIYDLYHDSFFMDQFMGEFAQNKINEIIDIINLYKIIDEIYKTEKKLDDYLSRYDLYKIFNSYFKRYKEEKSIKKDSWEEEFSQIQKQFEDKQFTDDIKTKIEDDKDILHNTIESIGEPILRNQLLDDVKNIGVTDKTKEIVETLKTKSHDEIEKELNKYDREKQIEIWKELFKIRDSK